VEKNMVTLHGRRVAAFVAAVGLVLPLTATPLPYTLETSFSVDGGTSTPCQPVLLSFSGADGTNIVSAEVGADASVFFNGDAGNTSFQSMVELSFEGITLRPGTAQVIVYTDGESGGIGASVDWSATAEFGGYSSCGPGCVTGPPLSCGGVMCFDTKSFPIMPGQPFSFSIAVSASATLLDPSPGNGGDAGGVADVQVTIVDSAGNPVPIYPASAVPEPAGLASVGLALIGGVYVIRRRHNV
jgi:hypothetical protein